ncbi:MAG: hypothetical protein OEL81_01320 [Nitrosopumilus sp.]|nr:hypothetical protein [Nitrosopumilus sp.]
MEENSEVKPTKLLVLVPIFLGLLGGILAYIALKDYSQEKANDAIYYSIISSVVMVGLYIVFGLIYMQNALSMMPF